jgi:hypothetical protein
MKWLENKQQESARISRMIYVVLEKKQDGRYIVELNKAIATAIWTPAILFRLLEDELMTNENS